MSCWFKAVHQKLTNPQIMKRFLENLKNFFFFIFAVPRSIWDLSSLTRDWTHTTCSGSTVLTTGWPWKSQCYFNIVSCSPSPFHVEPAAIDNQLVKGLLSSHFCSLPCGKLDESTLLSLHNSDGPYLSKLVEVISEGIQVKKNERWQHRHSQEAEYRLLTLSLIHHEASGLTVICLITCRRFPLCLLWPPLLWALYAEEGKEEKWVKAIKHFRAFPMEERGLQ